MTIRIQRFAVLHPARALYDQVNDVARYPALLPWCLAATVIESTETEMVAKLEISNAGICA